MKNKLGAAWLFLVLIVACKKDPVNPAGPLHTSIVGKWNVDSVITYFYDSTGLREEGVHHYPSGAPDYPYRFQFESDNNFIESIHLPSSADYVASAGTYSLTSDTSFTLTYQSAVAGKQVEPCKINSLTNTSFIFSKQLSTVFNGTDPGYIRYVYKLTRLQ